MEDIQSPNWNSNNNKQSYERLQTYSDGRIDYGDYSPEHQAEVQEAVKEIIEESKPDIPITDKIYSFTRLVQSLGTLIILLVGLFLLSKIL